MLIFLFLCAMGWLGAYIACQKERHMAEGFALGFLLSFVGVFIELFLPSKN